MKKCIAGLFSFMMIFSIVISAFTQNVYAAENQSTDEKLEQLQKDIATELKFYFEDVGELTANGGYTIKNADLLLQKTNETNTEYTQSLFQELTARNGLEYAACVADNTLGSGIFYELYSLFKGDERTVFVTEMTKHGWATVAEMLAPKLVMLGLDFNVAGLAAKFAIAAVTCAL